MIPRPSLRRALLVSAALHAIGALLALWLVHVQPRTELVDIELAPATPAVEALPAEVARAAAPPTPETRALAASAAAPGPGEVGELAIDAGVDAPVDAAVDAPVDARPADARIKPDARPDAGSDAASVATTDDAGTDDAGILASTDDAASDDAGAVASTDDAASDDSAAVARTDDAGPPDGGAAVASAADDAHAAAALASTELAGSGHASDPVAGAASDSASATAGSSASKVDAGAGSSAGTDVAGAGAPLDTRALAAALASGAVPGTQNAPAVPGAPTTAGTAANLLAYFPDGHLVTALIRFDRLRGTEWAAPTERLLRPLPDYQVLFGPADAHIADKLETLIISTPRPRDAAATTLVARTTLGRGALRTMLGTSAPVTWSTTRGGLLGRRGAGTIATDRRVFLSPFQGWFVLAQPADLGALLTAAKANPDTAVATGKLPPWLAGIRKIEGETGDPRGPALVVTLATGATRIDLAGRDFGLGLPSIPTPERVSLAAELVPQGWVLRGNMTFASEADAAELVAAVQRVQKLATGRTVQLVIGKPIARVIASFAFARSGARLSYAAAMSIADARAILAVVAAQLDTYFRRAP